MGKGRVHHGALRRVMAEVASSLLAGDGDGAEVMHQLTDQCVDVLGLAGAGVRLRGADGGLEPVSATDGRASRMEAELSERGDDPGVHAFRTGCPIAVADLGEDERWPELHAVADAVGYRGMASVPMPSEGTPIGVVTLYDSDARAWEDEDLETAGLLANLAAGHVMLAQSLADSRTLNQQLQHALDGRVVVEQAKGMLAARHGLDVNAAFDRLREYARAHRLRVHDVARDVVSGRSPVDLDAPPRGGDVSR